MQAALVEKLMQNWTNEDRPDRPPGVVVERVAVGTVPFTGKGCQT